MEDSFYINLAECVFGSEELDFLLKEWEKEPRPKTVNELARIYLTNQIEDKKGYLPYDRRRRYEVRDKIIIYSDKKIRPAEVIRVMKDYHKDCAGFSYDAIDLRLLDQATVLSRHELKSFIANYHGEELAGHAVRSFEIIKEKDEAEVIPKILMAISHDKRFVTFEGKWLPSELLVRDVSYKLSDIEKVIVECKQALSATDILEEVCADENREELGNRLEFSLNYFLNKDRRFIQISGPVTRWNLRQISKPDQPSVNGKREWTVTIQTGWMEKGILIIPRRSAIYMQGTNTVHILYDQIDEVLPYEESDRLIEGLSNFYSKKAIAEFDQVHIHLQALEPTRLFIHSSWKVSLDKLLRIEPQDLDWEQSSVRDCIIVVLAKFRTPAHYREIYTEIAIHKHVSWGGILGTLSRYCPSVFVHVGWGKWQLAGWAEEVIHPEQGPKVPAETVVINDEIWNAVTTIEENDYVYKLLEKIRKPLSFDEVCSRLADYLKVDVHELRATGFLKADDERFRRLDDGTWALEEWFTRDDRPEEPVEVGGKLAPAEETKPKEISKSGRFWLVSTILLILLLLSIVVIIVCYFIYWR